MKYLMLLYADSPMPEPGTAEARRLSGDWAGARQAMTDAGVLIDCAALQPAPASTTVRVRGGETLLTDGPAAEIKEVFGGLTLIECDGLGRGAEGGRAAADRISGQGRGPAVLSGAGLSDQHGELFRGCWSPS